MQTSFPSRFDINDDVVALGRLGTVVGVGFKPGKVTYDVDLYGGGETLYGVDSAFVEPAIGIGSLRFEDIFGPGGAVITIEPNDCPGCSECSDVDLGDDLDEELALIDSRYDIAEEIIDERERQTEIGNDVGDEWNTAAEWAGFIAQYAGRAVDVDFRENMVKVAALALAAIEAHDA